MRLLVTSCILLVLVSSASASIITLAPDTEISGAAAPKGPAPWITATFNDYGSQGTVFLTMTAGNLVGSEFVSEWSFNLKPLLNPDLLEFTKVADSGGFALPDVLTGFNEFKADGDGYYDILFNFGTSGGVSTRFTDNDWVTYSITGISSLTAASFNTLSYDGGGNGNWLTAAHVQGIGANASQSGWVADSQAQVPEPATMALLAIGGLAMLRRRRKLANA